MPSALSGSRPGAPSSCQVQVVTDARDVVAQRIESVGQPATPIGAQLGLHLTQHAVALREAQQGAGTPEDAHGPAVLDQVHQVQHLRHVGRRQGLVQAEDRRFQVALDGLRLDG
jgi:hypothetical protein